MWYGPLFAHFHPKVSTLTLKKLSIYLLWSSSFLHLPRFERRVLLWCLRRSRWLSLVMFGLWAIHDQMIERLAIVTSFSHWTKSTLVRHVIREFATIVTTNLPKDSLFALRSKGAPVTTLLRWTTNVSCLKSLITVFTFEFDGFVVAEGAEATHFDDTLKREERF